MSGNRAVDTRATHVRCMLLALGCAVVALGISWRLAPPMFCLNDDAKMQLILSGSSTLAPSAHAVFINYVLGGLIATLFGLAPAVPWWMVWQVGCVTVSVYLWNLALACGLLGGGRAEKGRTEVVRWVVAGVSCVLLDLVVLAYAASLLTFTHTAGVLAATAVLLLGARKHCAALGGRRRYGVCVALLVVAAYCTRSSALNAALPFAALVFADDVVALCASAKDRRGRALALARQLVPLVAGVVLACSCYVANRVAYRAPQWQEFLSTNAARHKYMDYPHESFDQDPQRYAEAGWSLELERLVNDEWFFMDPRVTKEAFLALRGADRQAVARGLREVAGDWRFGEGMFVSHTVSSLVMLACVLALATTWLADRNAQRLQAGAGLLCFLAEICYLALLGRVFSRVALVSLWPTVAFELGLFVARGGLLLQPTARDAREEGCSGRSSAVRALRLVAAVLLLLAAARVGLAAIRSDASWKLAYGMPLALAAVLLAGWHAKRPVLVDRVMVGSLAVALCWGSVLAVRDIRGMDYAIDEQETVAQEGLSYIAAHPDEQFYCVTSTLSFFDPTLTALPPNMHYMGGWEYYLPSNLEQMAALRGDAHSDYAMLLEGDARALVRDEEQADWLGACIEQVTGTRVAWEVAGKPASGVLCRYRVVS